MSIVLVPRSRRRLRRSSPTRLAPKDLDSTLCEDASEQGGQGVHEVDDSGVVRVGYTIRPRQSALINNLLVAIRRTTGNAPTASDIVRLAIDQVEKLPFETVVDLLAKQEKHKRVRR